MHTRVLGERNDAAHARILKAAKKLAGKGGVPAATLEGLSARDRDQNVAALLQREAVADLLEAVAGAVDKEEKAKAEAEEKAKAEAEEKAKAVSATDPAPASPAVTSNPPAAKKEK